MSLTRRSCLSGFAGAVIAGVVPREGAAQAQLIRRFTKSVAAPPLVLPGLDGTMHSLAALAGKPVLVAVWATWCAPCRAELPALLRLQRDLAAEGCAVLAVNVGDAPERVRRFLGQIDADGLDVLLDRERAVAAPWRVGGLPAAYGIGPSGDIAFSALGAVDWDGPEARLALTGLRTQPAETQSPG